MADKKKSKVYRLINIIVYGLGYYLAKILFKILCRCKVYGKKNVPKKGGCLIAPNHASFVDPHLVGSSCPREIYFFARSTLMKKKVFEILLDLWNCIPVDRDTPTPGSLKKAISVLRNGHALLVFPEGTRTEDGNLQEAKLGLGYIAQKAKVPIVPVYVYGTYDVLPKGAKKIKFRKVAVLFGKPLDFQNDYQTKGNEEIYQNISNRVMESIIGLKKEYESLSKSAR